MGINHNEGHILDGFPVENLRSDLLNWWSLEKRHFPWRETRDPYKILIAETLLHRTRADQVVPLYERFLKQFPNVQSLAKSTPGELRELCHSRVFYVAWESILLLVVSLVTI